MTNLEIITAAKKKLVADGKIGPEDEIHTYNHWKKLGYQVFRGEKAIASLTIWKSFQKKKQDDDEAEAGKEPQTGMRKKVAYFFSTQQVFLIEGE